MMPLPSEKTSFWQALSGVCCGTEIFARLIRQKAWRIVLHLFLLLLICSAIVPSIRMMLEREEINQSLMLLQKDFGKLLIYEDGMTPGLRPEESRTVVLGGALPLFYVADGEMPDWKQYREYPVLAVWQAKRLSFVQRLSETDAVLSSFPLGWSAAMLPEPEKVAWENLSAALKTEHEGISAKEPVAEEDFDFLRGMFWMTLCGVFWLEALSPLLIFLSLFIGVFTLTSTVRDRTLRYVELVKAGAYASCPAILVASFFPALDLPMLEYSTAYMIGAVCYFFVAVNRLERDRQEASAGQKE
ncbi:MAG: hypothetical protein J6R85_02850 [Lentisphaeria bacterium]|nr:hypothetical protein [Lentisphaeria bacterium]